MERVFVCEHVTSGAWSDRPLEGSLATEGRAMLVAIAEDLLEERSSTLATTWDRRLGPFPLENVEVRVVDNVAGAAVEFERLARRSDRTLVIAPELDGALLGRFDQVAAAGGRWVGCSREALFVAGDKLATAASLRRHGVPIIDTLAAEDHPSPGTVGQVVWKPRDGAGSVGIAVRDATATPPHATSIRQPLLPGRPLSVALIVDPRTGHADPLPVAAQRISDDDRLTYLGGSIPAPLEAGEAEAVRELAVAACGAIDGLAGWVGVDLLLPPDADPLVLEINPRLTTSYLGYRHLANGHLAARVLRPERAPESFAWHDRRIDFGPTGDWQHG